MANDRFFIRCTVCGDYLCLGKFYPGSGAYFIGSDDALLPRFIEAHLNNCQPQDLELEGPICLVFDNETSFCAAGGSIGGSGNVKVDQAERKEKPDGEAPRL